MPVKRELSWVIMHTGLVVVVVINLLTGLRIATLGHPELLKLSAILPQGHVHSLHLFGGFSLLGLGLSFLAYQLCMARPHAKTLRPSVSRTYHAATKYLGYGALLMLLLTGAGLYFGWFSQFGLSQLHFFAALALLAYVILHGAVYFTQHGLPALTTAISFNAVSAPKNVLFASVCLIGIVALYFSLFSHPHTVLTVERIDLDSVISIDGRADEKSWELAEELTLSTFGGANFSNGKTDIQIKALSNGHEMFFHFTWKDPTESLNHLPLVRTAQGWQVQQAGFQRFDETEYYEDKLAVIIANNCQAGAAGTAHLGPKPLADKPANWSGTGYHYTGDSTTVDLWHWKAVRTNDMFLADDNFIGRPDITRPASRRYTAGYMQDGKETGAYVMNWKWYQPGNVSPKRLPKNAQDITHIQTLKGANTRTSGVISWFDYAPYKHEDDTYPVGTGMPSVMYRSNRFEGDRADVRARGQWKDGRWSLELVRMLNTGSENDVVLADGVCLWVAAFDHAQIRHTRHVRPLKLKYRD